MTARRPIVRVGGRFQQLPAGDKLDVPAEWDALKAPAIAAGVLTIDLATPAGFRVALNQNVSTLNFANVPTGRVVVFTITWVQDATGSRTVAFPASVKADGGGAPLQPAAGANAVTVQSFYTDDGGVTVWQATTPYSRTNILGPVGQENGLPTGAIIERGSNASGEYVRFADGTQLCTVRFTGYVANTLKNLPMPAAFAAGGPSYQAISGGVTPAQGYDYNWTAYAERNNIGFISQSTFAQNIVTLIAIGRWYV